jgi:predicted negative regulator of RcsB-dependent stress response
MSQIDRRLKNVQQADLSESRINDDFVLWLKTWGSNILLVVMVIAALVMGWFRWQQHKADTRDAAWQELDGATLPAALQEIAARHEGADAIAQFAQLQAADRYLGSVLSGKRFDRDAGAVDAELTPELRTEWLKEADRLYAQVAERAQAAKGSAELGFLLSALFGRAAVAEDMGDLKAAEERLLEAKKRSEGSDFASVGTLADKRIASLQALASPVDLPSRPAAAPAAAPTAIPDLTGAPTASADGAPAPSAADDIVRQLQGGAPAAPSAPAPAPAPAPTP